MPSYELNYLIIPSLTTEEAIAYHEEIKATIKKEGGIVEKEHMPIKKKLAYDINKNSEAYLAAADFGIAEEKIKKIKEKIGDEKNILRTLLIKKEIGKKSEEEEPKRKRRSLKPEKAKLKEIDAKIDEML